MLTEDQSHNGTDSLVDSDSAAFRQKTCDSSITLDQSHCNFVDLLIQRFGDGENGHVLYQSICRNQVSRNLKRPFSEWDSFELHTLCMVGWVLIVLR